MKKSIKILSIIAFVCLSVLSFAQGPPEPEDGGGGTVGDVGGSAPISDGVAIMIVSAAAYGFGKQKVIELRIKK